MEKIKLDGGRITLIRGDCLEIMPKMKSGIIDLICADLPYGTTSCLWDTVIPFNNLWENYKRLRKSGVASILFGRNPFLAELICSNVAEYRYEIIWNKNAATDFAQANNKPLTVHENIAVFATGKIKYNRIDDTGFKPYSDKRTIKHNSELGAKGLTVRVPFEQKTTRTPTTIRTYFPDNRKGSGSSLHPTQKPVELLEWLILSYTNEGDLVLDNTMGSGTTAVACINTNRRFVGIEKDTDDKGNSLGYFDICTRRCEEALALRNQQKAA
jgi:DNA modification methylase